MTTKILLASLLFLVFVVSSSHAVSSHEDELRQLLMDGYNPAALPQKHTKTRISFTVLNFDMDEENQAMNVNLWVHLTWKDPRLAWRGTSKFYSINYLTFPADAIWKPDVTVYNHAEPRSADPYTKTQVHIKNDGNITWVPPAHIKASCSMDMTYWPHDVHNCTIKFGSWVHHIKTIDLYSQKDAVMSVENTRKFSRGEWKVTDSGIDRQSKVYACCPNEYVSITAWLVIKRIAPAYRWIVQAPAAVLGIFTFVIFLLPPSSAEKIIFGGVTLILDFFFLMNISKIIHYTADKTPLIIQYVSTQVILTAVTLIVSAIAINITRTGYASSLPTSLKKTLTVIARVLYVRDPSNADKNEQGGASSSEKGLAKDSFLATSTGNSDWMLLAVVVDRLCLVLFALIFVINLIIYCGVL